MAHSANGLSVVSLIKQTFADWNANEAPKLGASLAFYSMLSIGPLLLIAVSVAGMAFGHDRASHYLIEQMRNLLGVEGAKSLEDVLSHSQSQSKGVLATIIGLVTLLVSAGGFFGQLQSALNTIFEVPKEKTTAFQFVEKRLLSFGMVLGICLLLLSSLVISALLSAFTGLFHGGVTTVFLQAVNIVLSFVISTALFAAVYKVLPDIHIRWRDVWVGAAITALLFAIGKTLIGLYLGRSSFSSTYGAAGSLIVLLVWVYYSAQIIFFGAEFTKVYMRATGRAFVLKQGLQAASGAAPVTQTRLSPTATLPPAQAVSIAVVGSALLVARGVLDILKWRRRPG